MRSRTEVVDGYGRESLEGLRLYDRAAGRAEEVAADALFIMIGGEPHVGWLPSEIARSEKGYLLTGGAVRERRRARWAREREPMMLETQHAGRVRRR